MAKEQWEEDAIARFQDFLKNNIETVYAITGRDVVVNPVTGGNFDYQLQTQTGDKMAVEIFRLVNSEEELAQQRTWNNVVEHLKKELLNRGVKGYLISTPEIFKVRKGEVKTYSVGLADKLEKIIKANTGVKRFKDENFEFSKIKDYPSVVFSQSSGAKNIDTKGTVKEKFAENLPKKNNQVSVQNHERVLFVVSWAFFVEGEDAIQVLSGFDFSEFENIDKIFFEQRPGEISLVYDRTVPEAIKTRVELTEILPSQLLLKDLHYQLGEKKLEALEYVKTMTSKYGNMNWLENDRARENVVFFGEHLLSSDSLEETMWIVRQLQNDTNPDPKGGNDKNDPNGEHNYHQQVLKGEEVWALITVRGHLCWLMMKIVAKNNPKYYKEIISIMTRYLKGENLYIRIQASYILAELWRRRRARKNIDESPFLWDDPERDEVRKLALESVRENKSYPRVMEALITVFNDVRDLNEHEAEEFISLFLETKDDKVLHNLAPFVAYFAFFREQDSQYYGGNFNQKKFIEILKDQIINGESAMRSSLSWHFWKMLSDKILPWEKIRDYVLLFFEGKHDRSMEPKLGLIVEELFKTNPEEAAMLHEKILSSLENQLENYPEEPHEYFISGTEEVVSFLAREPQKLLDIVGRLAVVWRKEKQFYIGDIATIFGSFRLVEENRREEIKNSLKKLYDEMKSAQPYLKDIDWDN